MANILLDVETVEGYKLRIAELEQQIEGINSNSQDMFDRLTDENEALKAELTDAKLRVFKNCESGTCRGYGVSLEKERDALKQQIQSVESNQTKRTARGWLQGHHAGG